MLPLSELVRVDVVDLNPDHRDIVRRILLLQSSLFNPALKIHQHPQ